MRSAALIVVLGAVLLSGCGINMASADLFLLKRTGQGQLLTVLVSDGGTIRCNNGGEHTLPNALLLQARDLASQLDKDAKQHMDLPPKPNSVFTYRVQLQDGTITFADTSAAGHKELAQLELFVVQAAQRGCGISV